MLRASAGRVVDLTGRTDLLQLAAIVDRAQAVLAGTQGMEYRRRRARRSPGLGGACCWEADRRWPRRDSA